MPDFVSARRTSGTGPCGLATGIFRLLLLALSLASVGCSRQAPAEFQSTVASLTNSNLNFFWEPFEKTNCKNGLVQFQWERGDTIVAVYAEGKDEPIRTVLSTFLAGDTKGIAILLTTIMHLNQWKDGVVPDSIADVFENGVGTSVDVGVAKLTFEGMDVLRPGEIGIVVSVNPISQ